jgi:DNA-binding CsgD family transcriptional regulator
MAASAQKIESFEPAAVCDRATLTLFLGELAEASGAEFYMLLATASRDRRVVGRVVSANWVFDAVELVGIETLGDLTGSQIAFLPGMRPRSLLTQTVGESEPAIDAAAKTLLNRLGHAELYCLRLNVGRHHYYLLLSGSTPGAIDADGLGAAQMRCNYTLSAMSDELRAAILKDVLTGRERECLAWAAEGKTSEDIALILGVHASIANGAIAAAMEKLHARNRVEAVATAIRIGIL